jgi:chemotaxis protein MotB
MVKGDPIIIVRKKRRHGHGHHGGAWKVAYADFVTAMMAFFLVMWIVGQSQTVRAAVAGYFRDPGIFEQQRSTGPIAGGEASIDPNATPFLPREARQEIERLLKQTAEEIRRALAAQPSLSALANQIEIQVTAEGLRIELVESTTISFFDSGSAVLRPESIEVLTVIAGELGRLGKPVILEGHTDNRQYTNRESYTNWELSSDRANAARRAMLGHGLVDGQIDNVRGYADTRPRISSDAADPRNRRVSIVVRTFDERDLAGLLQRSAEPSQ